ncbi:unnamed protein product [Fraxinus pennsylvanica]|uniref:Uncharacterized protein n=1 Tax=Fraxinus pennsylvanica TaxID=56036 RepID=A0AAD2E5J0_9LAMI|nr:unnamed protein product [Fraxinus pennsylvanica]
MVSYIAGEVFLRPVQIPPPPPKRKEKIIALFILTTTPLAGFVFPYMLTRNIFRVDQVQSARHTQFLKVKPKSLVPPDNFYGYLPKGMPVPPSGPSRKHNDIGLRGWQGSP